jgi:lipid-A-disaccharide synthase
LTVPHAASVPHLFISVAEESADMHAAALVRACLAAPLPCRFSGLTGPRLRALGVPSIDELASQAAMLGGIVRVLGRARRALERVRTAWRSDRPDLVILIDSPELNLRLAARARALNIPVLYYIAPQTWAARPYRNRIIADTVDRLACILPFEEAYFRRAGVAAEFVGHPLFETLRDEQPNPAVVSQLTQGADARRGEPLIAILPGSRPHVIETMLPLQLDVLRRLRAAGRRVSAVVSCLSGERAAACRRMAADMGVEIDAIVGDNASLLTAAELALVTSGTGTLHVAHYRKPMIVMYDVGPALGALHGLIGRWAIASPHLSLVNVLAGRRVVPEFMPRVRDAGAVARVAGQLLSQPSWRALMRGQLDDVVRPLESSRASRRVVEIMRELLPACRRA